MMFCKKCGEETERHRCRQAGKKVGQCKQCAQHIGAAYRQSARYKALRREREQRPEFKLKRAARNRANRGLPVATRPRPELCELGCGRKAVCLEHCHETNAFRGWTCSGCNTALAALGDNLVTVLARVTRYRELFVADFIAGILK